MDRAVRRSGTLATVMFLLPVAVALAMCGLARVVGDAPDLDGVFDPADHVVRALLVIGLPYAAVFMVLMNRVRRAQAPLPAGSRPGKGDMTVASIWGMGLMVWLMVPALGGVFVCASVNRMVGTVVTESARIESKSQRQGKGCHRRIWIVSATVRDGRSLCVPHDDWDRLDDNDRLPIVAITSGLGQEVGLAPGALSHVTKETE